MKVFRTIGFNFVGGIWTGVLVISTTPFYVSTVGLEGFGLIGFWQLLLFVSAIFDFGLGASLLREFSRYKGSNEPAIKYLELLRTIQWFYVCIGLVVGATIYLAANWLATDWLNLVGFSGEDASLIIKLMAGSIALQFINTLYSNALGGLQKHAAMNAFLVLGNTLKYLGGMAVLLIENSLVLFFAFQIISVFIVCYLTRRHLVGQLSEGEKGGLQPAIDLRHIRQLSRYSAGMFITALCGLLLANVDRIVLSKLVTAEDFGVYTLAFTAVGLLQMVILAFYRSYFPRFSELKAAGDEESLKAAYYQGCSFVGIIIVPAAVAACVFAPELFRAWIGHYDERIINIFRLLIIGTVCSGLMWLPAALQQAVGWTRLHISLMMLALVMGFPLLFLSIQDFGIVGATAMVLVHGAIEISLGLWLMNRLLYPGENLRWYGVVLISPLLASLPVALASASLMPAAMDRIFSLGWLVGTGLVMLFFAIMLTRRLMN